MQLESESGLIVATHLDPDNDRGWQAYTGWPC